MTRIVGPNAAVQAAVRRHYYEQPLQRSRIIAPPIPPPVVIPVAVGVMFETEPGWHLPGDHDDLVMLATEGALVGLFLVVIVVGFWTSVRFVRRPISEAGYHGGTHET